MKITSFTPLYGTENIDEAVDFFGRMGFAVQRRRKNETVFFSIPNGDVYGVMRRKKDSE